MKRINKIAEIILLLILTMIFLTLMYCKQETPKPKIAKIVAIEPVIVEEQQEEIVEEVIEKVVEEPEYSYTTRMTSYYPEEDTDCTGSGLCSWDFETNEFGWYTYQGKLVVATATMYLLNEGFTLYEGVHTYKYGDEITLTIDGVDYQAIVLDSCGNCCKTDRIDLFVSGSWAVKDTMIEVK